ncbi:MAG: hypothetical protein ACREQN_05350 [Candidatus Binataceae bacterium]
MGSSDDLGCLSIEVYYKGLIVMREPVLSLSSFPTAPCGNCARTVLAYVGYVDGEERRYCVHCDCLIGSELEWVTAEELETEGYSIGVASAPRAGGGCGSGCGTCSVRKH